MNPYEPPPEDSPFIRPDPEDQIGAFVAGMFVGCLVIFAIFVFGGDNSTKIVNLLIERF